MRKLTSTFIAVMVASVILVGCSSDSSEVTTPEPEEQKPEVTAEFSDDPTVDESTQPEIDPYEPIEAEPFKEAWPTQFKRSDAISTALFRNFEFFDSRIATACPYSANVIFELESDYRENVEKIADAMMKIFCEELDGDFWLVVGDYPFLKATIAELELESDEFGGICGIENPYNNTGCALFRTAWVMQDVTDNWLRNLAAHEIFHIVQDSISPEPPSWRTPPGSPIRIPNWITEGSATYFAAALNAYLGPDTYGDHLGAAIELLPEPRTNVDISTSQMANGFTPTVYNVGQFATEYLVAATDFESYMNLWHSRDSGMNFDDAVLASFGLSLEELYQTTSSISLDADDKS